MSSSMQELNSEVAAMIKAASATIMNDPNTIDVDGASMLHLPRLEQDALSAIEQHARNFVKLAGDIAGKLKKAPTEPQGDTKRLLLKEISDLRNEIAEKDKLLHVHTEKLSRWQHLLSDLSSTPSGVIPTDVNPEQPTAMEL
eukprot:GILJ01011121.1.p1 GENE.GILJ01011121.1~~GILJ01011121.1.p1  ORF type:complete len:142 (-),score=26.81 GILJ01011121.1:331-756(-)